ncbi:MAG: DUF4145 domain-containing protein [Betaproteobacteria bacterium]|nr:DUF4145 domain-containing protein [Betaproteobacteria bacterium]
MSELVADCPRCGSRKITFDVTQEHHIGIRYDWQYWFEAFCVCRHCKCSTIFVLSQNVDSDHGIVQKQGLLKLTGAVNRYMDIESFVSLKDSAAVEPPKHLPEEITAAFAEGAKCLAIGCHNAAGTMFRLCVDIATRDKLPATDERGLNAKIRRNLGMRLPWLIDNGLLPEALRELSSCVKEDGNDGAHAGTLSKEDADDLLDFTIALLERMYTEPERLRLAKERRESRRKPPSSI